MCATDRNSEPSTANGVVYGTLRVRRGRLAELLGLRHAKTCTALWGAVSGFIGGGSPAVVAGVMFINVSGDGTVYAYSL